MNKIAIATNSAHIASALNMKNGGNFYLELAKNTEWNDASHPDEEDSKTQNLEQSQIFIKVDKVLPVYKGDATDEVDDGSDFIVYKGHKWLFSSNEDAYTNNAKYLLFQTTLDIQEVPAFKYHQIGIRQGTKIPNAVHSATADAVTDKGILYAYENRQGASYTDNMKMKISYIMEF